MKIITAFVLAIALLAACNVKNSTVDTNALPIEGTWQLISGTTIEKGDTSITDYTKTISFIKIINSTHFAFLKHDLSKGKDSATASFGAGGGVYSLAGNTYTEQLAYCSDRQWEDNNFIFTVTIQNDTLIQSGIEKVENAGINRLNIEKYVRVKNK